VLLEEILGGLFQVELQQGHFDQAIGYLEQLKKVSPSPESIQRQIDEIRRSHPPSG